MTPLDEINEIIRAGDAMHLRTTDTLIAISVATEAYKDGQPKERAIEAGKAALVDRLLEQTGLPQRGE